MSPGETAARPTLSWRVKIYCAVLDAVTGITCRKDGTINRSLMKFLDFPTPAGEKPHNGVSSVDVTVDSSTNVWFRLFTPASTSPGEKLPVVVFFHGGGFGLLSPDSRAYDAVCRRFCRKLRAIVVSVNYRLAPEHKYPAAYDDAVAVIRWISQPGRLPETANLDQCFVAGDSAGANIVHHTGVRIASNAEEFHPVRVNGLILIQPFFGGEERTPSEIRLWNSPIAKVDATDFLWKAFLPEGSDRDHPAANVFSEKAPDISGIHMPPCIVFIGGFDPLQDRQRRYVEWMNGMEKEVRAVEYPSAIHAFYVFPEIPESGELIGEVKTFMKEQCSRM